MQGALRFPWLVVDEQEVGVLFVSPPLQIKWNLEGGLGKLFLGIRPAHIIANGPERYGGMWIFAQGLDAPDS